MLVRVVAALAHGDENLPAIKTVATVGQLTSLEGMLLTLHHTLAACPTRRDIPVFLCRNGRATRLRRDDRRLQWK